MDSLKQIHETLCHPDVKRIRIFHFIRKKNLPFTMEEVDVFAQPAQLVLKKKLSLEKPQFFKPDPKALIKATQPFERLSADLKG